jgi:hypothetical protein
MLEDYPYQLLATAYSTYSQPSSSLGSHLLCLQQRMYHATVTTEIKEMK